MALSFLILLIVVTTLVAEYPPMNQTAPHITTYPITASWFRDRYSKQEWDQALQGFQKIGGDTVWLRAPPLVPRSRDDILQDPDFIWCGSSRSSPGTGKPHCVIEAENELQWLGLVIRGYATYCYEEDFSEQVMLCPPYDRRISSSRVYYRLVLPLLAVSDPCNLAPGSEVLVLFTMYSGTDPHATLLQSAWDHNMTVYFGLPAAPKVAGRPDEVMEEILPAYYHFVYRVLLDHKYRFGKGDKSTQNPYFKTKLEEHISKLTFNKLDKIYERKHPHSVYRNNKRFTDPISIYNPLKGYYIADEVCLAQVVNSGKRNDVYLEMYNKLGLIVHNFDKQVALSPYIILNRSMGHHTVNDHVEGFEALALSGAIDIIAVQEGRGCGKGSYYWPDQLHTPIRQVDPGLDLIIHYLDPEVRKDVTYREQFTASNNQLFRMLGDRADKLRQKGHQFEFWLNIEAFEYLREEPCLPIDSKGSGMAELLQRTTKPRVDWALNVAGAAVNKVISFAWDPDFLCVPPGYVTSLAEDIIEDSSRPIISECGWKSPFRLSVIVKGYNIARATQLFKVVISDMARFIVEEVLPKNTDADYGLHHHRVPTLQYAELDVLPPWPQHGKVQVTAVGQVEVTAVGQVEVTVGGQSHSHHSCVFIY